MLHRLAHRAPARVFLAVLVDDAQNLELPGIVDLDPQDILVIVELDRLSRNLAFGPRLAVDRDLTGEGRVRLAVEEAQDAPKPVIATRSSRTISSTSRSLNSRSVAYSQITHQYAPNPAV